MTCTKSWVELVPKTTSAYCLHIRETIGTRLYYYTTSSDERSSTIGSINALYSSRPIEIILIISLEREFSSVYLEMRSTCVMNRNMLLFNRSSEPRETGFGLLWHKTRGPPSHSTDLVLNNIHFNDRRQLPLKVHCWYDELLSWWTQCLENNFCLNWDEIVEYVKP